MRALLGLFATSIVEGSNGVKQTALINYPESGTIVGTLLLN